MNDGFQNGGPFGMADPNHFAVAHVDLSRLFKNISPLNYEVLNGQNLQKLKQYVNYRSLCYLLRLREVYDKPAHHVLSRDTPVGRIMRLARPSVSLSVRPSVCPVRDRNWKTKNAEKSKLVYTSRCPRHE